MTITRDKIAGAVYGTALGDALGRPTEFMQLKEIHRRYGRTAPMTLPRPALFTDDTQMTIAVARALSTARRLTPRELRRTLRVEFIRWADVDPARAPGVTCLSAIRKLRKHVRWQDATVIRSKGCGANMRVVPAAFVRRQDDATGIAQLQAAMTHGHPTALAAAELTALAVRWAATCDRLQELPGRLLGHCNWRMDRRENVYRADWLGKLAERHWPSHGWVVDTPLGWAECARGVLRAIKLFYEVDEPRDVCAVTGDGWAADDALATALYFAIRYADDPALAISHAARTSGDSDSIACIAGAILGAFHGEKAWPTEWRQRIERRADLEWTIDVTHALS